MLLCWNYTENAGKGQETKEKQRARQPQGDGDTEILDPEFSDITWLFMSNLPET